MRTCCRCKQTKLLADFYKRKNGSPHSYCKPCHRESTATRPGRKEYMREYTKRWQKKNRGKIAAIGRRFRAKAFGLTERDYRNMLERQNGVCAICGGTDGDKALAMDHDHKTGRLRGFLCFRCNIGLGYFQDNEEFLLKAAAYTREASSNYKLAGITNK